VHEISSGPLREAAIVQLEVVRQLLAGYAAQAGVADRENFSYQMQTLMMGAMVSALRGDLDAAQRAREVAASWIGLAQ
jgi:hypothetical protein